MSKRHYYAQLNELNEVIALSDLSGAVTHPSLIKLASLDEAQLGDVYTDGVFVTPAPEAQG